MSARAAVMVALGALLLAGALGALVLNDGEEPDGTGTSTRPASTLTGMCYNLTGTHYVYVGSYVKLDSGADNELVSATSGMGLNEYSSNGHTGVLGYLSDTGTLTAKFKSTTGSTTYTVKVVSVGKITYSTSTMWYLVAGEDKVDIINSCSANPSLTTTQWMQVDWVASSSSSLVVTEGTKAVYVKPPSGYLENGTLACTVKIRPTMYYGGEYYAGGSTTVNVYVKNALTFMDDPVENGVAYMTSS